MSYYGHSCKLLTTGGNYGEKWTEGQKDGYKDNFERR